MGYVTVIYNFCKISFTHYTFFMFEQLSLSGDTKHVTNYNIYVPLSVSV